MGLTYRFLLSNHNNIVKVSTLWIISNSLCPSFTVSTPNYETDEKGEVVAMEDSFKLDFVVVVYSFTSKWSVQTPPSTPDTRALSSQERFREDMDSSLNRNVVETVVI